MFYSCFILLVIAPSVTRTIKVSEMTSVTAQALYMITDWDIGNGEEMSLEA